MDTLSPQAVARALRETLAGAERGSDPNPINPSADGRILWLDPDLAAPQRVAAASVRGRVSAEICIVGGGFLGLWTALRILELRPDSDVAVVEAGTCGIGASGRNAGFAMTLWSKAPTLVKRVGEAEAARIAAASEDTVRELESFCRNEGIACDWGMPGWLWTASAPGQAGGWRSTIETCEKLGAKPFVELTVEETRERMRNASLYGSAYEAVCGVVDPGRLIDGMRTAALSRGVRIYENSPVIDVDRASQAVTCLEGTVSCRQTVLATNAWLAKLPELRRVIVPVSADLIATAPLGGVARELWPGEEAYSNSRTIIDYGRPTPDGRIILGRGGAEIAYAARLNPGFHRIGNRANVLRTEMNSLLPELENPEVTHAWAGPIDRTMDGLPFVGRLPGSDVLVGGGFSGNGVGPTRLFSKILAPLALGIEDEWSTSAYVGIPDGRFPPEPVRYFGGRLVRRAVQARIEAIDSGRTWSPLVDLLANQAPGGMVKLADSKPEGEGS
jgi:glycine/D-amino acid oxidase-like deaminating enzyme